MQSDIVQEVRRQAEICNACRYCEGYCAVFPALHRERAFSEASLTQLANLCHNCRSCYYACQYTDPHEFALNLPKALAELRQDSWETYAYPAALAKLFQRSGVAIAVASVLGFAIILWAMRAIGAQTNGDGFYALLSHSAMVTIFLPAFFLPLLCLAIGVRRYWRSVGGDVIRTADLIEAGKAAASMKNLSGGHGDGCNFEDEDRFSHSRRLAHQAVMYGFLLCFASTSSATVLHYLFDAPAPYPFWSLPKLLGVPGGLLMMIGSVWLGSLKVRADRNLGDPTCWGGEMGFLLLLFLVATSGLALYVFGGTLALPLLLALHLGTVLSLFVLTPFTKMAHGAYRLAALIVEAQHRRAA